MRDTQIVASVQDADLVTTSRPKPRTRRRELEKIEIMETRPQDRWFQQARDPWGRIVWFLRLEVTGLRTRRYGPFATKRKGLLFLDFLLDNVSDGICEADNGLPAYQVPRRPFGLRRGHYPVVEDELGS